MKIDDAINTVSEMLKPDRHSYNNNFCAACSAGERGQGCSANASEKRLRLLPQEVVAMHCLVTLVRRVVAARKPLRDLNEALSTDLLNQEPLFKEPRADEQTIKIDP